MKVIATIEGSIVYEHDDKHVSFVGRGRVDTDGLGSSHGDKYHQNDTSLHQHGKPLNADVDLFIVLPPQIIKAVGGICLGCLAHVEYKDKGTFAVVGDIGPTKRLGEISYRLAKILNIDPNPNTGGIDTPDLFFTVHPGKPAEVDGKLYTLQPYRVTAKVAEPDTLKYAPHARPG